MIHEGKLKGKVEAADRVKVVVAFADELTAVVQPSIA
jgi:hypothetical protein